LVGCARTKHDAAFENQSATSTHISLLPENPRIVLPTAMINIGVECIGDWLVVPVQSMMQLSLLSASESHSATSVHMSLLPEKQGCQVADLSAIFADFGRMEELLAE
jgi:hypothetical protein